MPTPIDNLTWATLFFVAMVVALAVAPDTPKLPKPLSFLHTVFLEVLLGLWNAVTKIPLVLFTAVMFAGGAIALLVVVITAAIMTAIVFPFYLIKRVRTRYKQYNKEQK